MNFLAHVFLSGSDHEVKIGNFMGDFVKGAQIDRYEANIALGIRLHRQIDHFTDTHEVVRQSKHRLTSSYRHYSGVIVDVFYDHFLAKDWNKYSDEPLESFTLDFYEMVWTNRGILPDKAKHMLSYMKRDNWLYNYRLTEGIRRALTGMSQRTTFESGMEKSSADLIQHYDEFKSEFHDFFPDLQSHCQDFLEKHQ